MSTFKLKPEKVRHAADVYTLDEAHKKIAAKFNRQQLALPKKKSKLGDLQKELEMYEQKPHNTYTMEDIRKKSQLKIDIKKMEDEIYDIENNVSEMEYYSMTDDILMDYYDIVDDNTNNLYDSDEKEKKDKDKEKEPAKIDSLDILNMMNKNNKKYKKVSKRRKKNPVTTSENTILNYFNGNVGEDKIQNTETETDITTETEETVTENSNIKDEIEKEVAKESMNRKQLLDQYRMLTDTGYVGNRKKYVNMIKYCNLCNVERTLIQSEGIYVCQICGDVTAIIVESEKPNYKDSGTQEKAIYAYKRQNHYNEWLSQFQAKESTDIPESVCKAIIAELHKHKIYVFNNLKLSKIKEILKKLNMTQYYEHATHIISKLSGKPPPTISRDTEEKLRLMFRKIQAPFEKHCPKTRINFLSYSYVLHKFCQLLELDEFIKCFPLLKSRDKLRQQDKIWEKICMELKWEFIPSI